MFLTLVNAEISTQPEGAILAQLLNQFLTGAQLEIFFPDMKDTTQHQIHTATREEKAVEAELLKDPQLAAAMREGTTAAHKAAENSVFTKYAFFFFSIARKIDAERKI